MNRNIDKTMSYAIQVLKKEKDLLDNCLRGFDKTIYKEAYKRQKRYSNELQKAIDKLNGEAKQKRAEAQQ